MQASPLSISRTFHSPKLRLCTHRKSLLFPYSPVASILLSVSWNFTIPGNSKSGIRIFALLRLPIFILNNVPQSHPCCSWCQNFRLNDISSYGENTFCVFISIFWLVWTMLLWSLIYKNLFKSLLSVLLDIYAELELLDHMVILHLKNTL